MTWDDDNSIDDDTELMVSWIRNCRNVLLTTTTMTNKYYRNINDDMTAFADMITLTEVVGKWRKEI